MSVDTELRSSDLGSTVLVKCHTEQNKVFELFPQLTINEANNNNPHPILWRKQKSIFVIKDRQW